MKNQPEINQDEMKADNKAAATIPEEKTCKAEDKASATIPQEKTGMLIGPSTSTPGIPSSSQNFGNLIDIFGLGPLSDTDVENISNYNKETFISIHNRALEKFSRIANGEYACMSDRFDGFDLVQTQYKHLGRRRDLIVVPLSDLDVWERNELRVMYGELCVDPFSFGRIYTVMKEADTEDGIALSIVHPDFFSTDQSYAKRAYPKGAKIALKQPRLVQSLDGFKWLNVDNPRSIVRIERFPESTQMKFQDWFDSGGRAHDTEDWEACVRNYTKCEIILSQTATETLDINRMSFRFQLHSKRSRAYIGLARYTEALQDALTCCTIDSYLADSLETLIQGSRLRIEALLSLGRYKDAYWFLKDILSGDSSEETKSLVQFYRQKCIEYYRMGEAIVGIPERQRDCIPDADYIGPVVVKKSSKGQGRGLFTTEFVKAGTVLLICRALARCDDDNYTLENAAMANGLVRNVQTAISHLIDNVLMIFLSFDPSSAKFFKRYGPKLPDFAFNDVNSVPMATKMRIREEYEKLGTEGILRILRMIAFDDRSPENIKNRTNPAENQRYYGIWLIPSLLNHSCLPNASRINVSDVMSIHATKDINNGEEITIPYFSVVRPYHLRQAACRTWGFSCVCERCQFEGTVVPLDDGKRIYEKFLQAYLDAGRSITNADGDKRSIDLEAMGKLSEELDGWLESLGGLLGGRGSMWIRSSFILLYLARLRLSLEKYDHRIYEENSYRKYLYNLTIVKEALLGTCPGDIRRLLLDCRNMATYRQIAAIHPEYEGFYQRIVQLKKSCDSVYGCQKRKIVKALLRDRRNSFIM